MYYYYRKVLQKFDFIMPDKNSPMLYYYIYTTLVGNKIKLGLWVNY